MKPMSSLRSAPVRVSSDTGPWALFDRQATQQIEADAQESGITDAELSQAKSKICSHIVLQSERPSSRLFALGVNWLQRREYQTVREAVSAYQAVTRADVSAVLEKYPLNECTTLVIGPLKELGI